MGEQKNILVVDDDKFFRTVLTDALRNEYNVFEAAGGEEATKMVPIVCPDLILLDIEMPDRNGIDVCKELKNDGKYKYIPIILVTSRSKNQDIMLGLHAGADDYLTKPIYLPEVVARVDSHLNSNNYCDYLEYSDLSMILDLYNSIAVSRNPKNILRTVVKKLSSYIKNARFSVVKIDENGEMSVKVSSDLDDGPELPIEMSRYPEIKLASVTKKAVVINDITKSPIMSSVRGFVENTEFQTILIIPIVRKQIAIGTFFLRMASTVNSSISKKIYNLCHLVANMAANALENAALFESMRIAQDYLEAQSVRDGLTKLFTHQFFYSQLEKEFSKSNELKESLSIIFFDIDDFKQINDNYGHFAGDEVLREIGNVIRTATRDKDIPARYGGEEFAIILPSTDADGAMKMAKRFRSIIKSLKIKSIDEKQVTVSVGVTTMSKNRHESYEQLVKYADKAMYKAKKEGKDKIIWMS